ITAPANGTVIMPGESFAFSYDPMADYGVSTYNYTVFLFTKLPSSLYSSTEWSSGHYFGRFDYPNYPGKFEALSIEYGLMIELQRYQYATHEALANLTMPDFSKAPSPGWGGGGNAT
ncbi:hypothetical protein IW261DRAFT_1344343, partial [Armillaria novae-zelandiae]